MVRASANVRMMARPLIDPDAASFSKKSRSASLIAHDSTSTSA